MKIKRYKKVQQYLDFYKIHFGFREPYQVLIDGSFCYQALMTKVNIKEQLPKYLLGNIKFLTTACAVKECDALGYYTHGSSAILKQYSIHKCNHQKERFNAFQCFSSMIADNNPSRYMIATQDLELQQYSTEIPGTPVLYLHSNTLTLKKPSIKTYQAVDIINQKKLFLTNFEKETLKNFEKVICGVKDELPLKKFKKIRGPNPLSCKKKSKKASLFDEMTITQQKKKRKRFRMGKHVKEELFKNNN